MHEQTEQFNGEEFNPDDFEVVPIYADTNTYEPIGTAVIRKDAIPKAPDYSFSIIYSQSEEQKKKEPDQKSHDLISLLMLTDLKYFGYIKRDNTRGSNTKLVIN